MNKNREAANDLITCEESENANELSRIAIYWMCVAEAYRELAEAYKMAIRWRHANTDDSVVQAIQAKIKELEGGE